MTENTKTPVMPESFQDVLIPTLNNTGFMTKTLDKYSKAFVKYAGMQTDPVLEVGAAYGIASIAALKEGASVIANDLDKRHLEILKARTPIEYHDHLTLMPGDFPDELNVAPNSLDGVLICRVLHWFDGDKLEKSARKLYDWLKPNAKAFIMADTPYLGNAQPFIPIYEDNVKSGKKWPGYITGIKDFTLPQYVKHLPEAMHFLDPTILSRVFKEAGFEIETATTFARPEYPADAQLDGKESVAVIARKV